MRKERKERRWKQRQKERVIAERWLVCSEEEEERAKERTHAEGVVWKTWFAV